MRSRITLTFSVLAALGSLQPLRAQNCTFAAGPDVIVGDLTSPANYSANGNLEALAIGTTSCNIGNALLNWISNTNQHPVIGQNLYRYRLDPAGYWRFEQVGLSWLKHGFAALQGSVCCSNCSPSDGSHLGTGCSDPYSGGLNGGQPSLGPRWQVNPDTGVFAFPPANPSWSGTTARRLEVLISDLESAPSSTCRFFGEGHYVTPDDATAGNNNNNASYREMTVSGSGTSWSFGFAGSTQRQQSAIRAWRQIDPGVNQVDLQMPFEGLVTLAYKVTDLGGGTWHYEYALYNMNSDDGVGTFAVPVPAGVTVTNIDFHDVEFRNGDGIGSVSQSTTNWPVSTVDGKVQWKTEKFSINPNANALRWGTTYNFRFDADSPPQAADVSISRFKSGMTHAISAQAPSPVGEPGVAYCTDTDGASALCPCGNAGLPGHGCENAHGTGGVQLQVTSFAPDGFGGGTATILGTNFPVASSPTTLVIRSTGHESPPTPFGDGLLCVSSTNLVRFGSTFAISGTSTHPVNHGAGAGTFSYQVWYRSSPAFCTPDQFNLSNGYDLTW